MPFINYDPIDEADAINAASLNSRFNAIKNGIDSIDVSGVQVGGLGFEVLPAFALNEDIGLLSLSPKIDSVVGPVTITMSGGWPADGSAPAVPAVPVTGLSVDFGLAFDVGDAGATRCSAILLQANLQLDDQFEISPAIDDYTPQMFLFQYSVNGTTWINILPSEIFYHRNVVSPILGPGDKGSRDVAMIYMFAPKSLTSVRFFRVATEVTLSVDTNNYRSVVSNALLTAIPFHAEV